jgi:hypothetical protein
MIALATESTIEKIIYIQAVGSPGASAYQVTKTAQIRMNDFLMAEYGEKVIKSFQLLIHA